MELDIGAKTNFERRQRDAVDVTNVVAKGQFPDDALRYLERNKDTVYKAIKHLVISPSTEATPTNTNLLTHDIEDDLGGFKEKKQTPFSKHHSRKDFFHTIKKQYHFSPDGSCFARQISDTKRTDDKEAPYKIDATFITNTIKSRKRRLNELRKLNPINMDLSTRMEWIRTELFEMREQDKGLFLQLAELDAAIKEVRNKLKMMEEDSKEDEEMTYFCRWPRSTSSSELSDLSSSDGARELKHTRPLKRGLSLQLHSRPTRRPFQNKLFTINSTE